MIERYWPHVFTISSYPLELQRLCCLEWMPVAVLPQHSHNSQFSLMVTVTLEVYVGTDVLATSTYQAEFETWIREGINNGATEIRGLVHCRYATHVDAARKNAAKICSLSLLIIISRPCTLRPGALSEV